MYYDNFMYPCEIEGGLDRGRCPVWAASIEEGCDTDWECYMCRKHFYQRRCGGNVKMPDGRPTETRAASDYRPTVVHHVVIAPL
jgi:hypothetical protein